MDNRLLEASLLGLAAFFHDIGKAYQRTGKHLPADYGKNTFERQLLLNKDSHLHALHTAYFFEQNFGTNSIINKLWKETFEKSSLMRVSAGHHNPDRDDILAKIIAKSDQVASGFDRGDYEKRQKITPTDYRKVMLVPLLKLATLFGKQDDTYRYVIDTINISSIFPKKKNDINNKAEENYKKIIDMFEEGLSKIPQNLDIYFDAIQTLCEESFTLVPSSTLGEYDDISLYDHMKTTSAIATALYNYIKDIKDKELPNLPQDEEKSLLVVRGEFFGIQKFIFSKGAESDKNPAKILRGRSFYVSLLTEIASEIIRRALYLPSFNIMLNTAGMFVIIAQNTDQAKKTIIEVKKNIEDWLFKKFYGEVSFGIASEEASLNDFSEKHFEKIWLNILTKMDEEKYSRFSLNNRVGLFADYHKKFAGKVCCPYCGKEPVSHFSHNMCDTCFEFEEIGEKLTKNKFIVLTEKEKGIFDKIGYHFLNHEKDLFQKENNIFKVIDFSLFTDFSGYGKSKINTYVAKDDDSIKSFEEIAATKEHPDDKGIEAIGVFKADVDNLGAIFAVGLELPGNVGENKRLTFSRLSQMSRMINNFFAYYLPYKLRESYPNTYTVFAGGDDLFLIGKYDKIFDLSLELEKDFKAYVGHNPEITISGGISIFKPNTPIAFMAEVVENNLELSKAKKDSSNIKGNLTILGATAKWDEFRKMFNSYKNIETFIQSRSFIYKLLTITSMRQHLKHVKNNLNLMSNIMWIPRLKYLIARQKYENDEKEQIAKYLYDNIESKPELFKAILMIELYKIREKRR